ncbi:unnamed protein product [Candidula unifasciata]|uniref:Galactose-3-O-sulfotransferase 2-like n=1 Tax=Candidula unifasciata TaxID=100452 RepID=A0A8S3ZGM0_9EUPU|nr:unnamed protein product [Candidula unifasciata]
MNACCKLLTRRKRKVFLLVLVFITFVYFLLMSYLACCQLPQQGNVLSSYVLDPNGRTLYEQGDKREIRGARSKSTNCSEQRNFVFIKTMKCATSTLHGVFYRFGYTRNLSFVSPIRKMIYLNWPFPMTMQDFRPSSRGYNILTDHVIYTEDVMDKIMPADTVYISIIREPFAHFKSTFHYFNVAKISGVPANVTNPIVEYLSHLEKYEPAYMSHKAKERWCVPNDFSITKNMLSHSLGMPLGFPPGTINITADEVSVEQYIKHLDSKFQLILIVEYFYESVVLLRRLMCWSFRDIIFINSNTGDYEYKNASVPESIIDIHRKWSSVDYRLYDYFNNTFWKRVSLQGADFYSEVEAFKKVEAQVKNYCLTLYQTFTRDEFPFNMTKTTVSASLWNEQFSVTHDDCWMLGPDPNVLHRVVQKENDLKEANLLLEQQKILDNRTLKGVC